MRIRMTSQWNGFWNDVHLTLLPDKIVEGPLAEHIHGKRPDWCEVLAEPEPTLPEPMLPEPTPLELPTEPILQTEPEPPPAPTEPEPPTLPAPEPSAMIEPAESSAVSEPAESSAVIEEVNEVRPFFAGPPADKMLDGRDITPKGEDLSALPFKELARRAAALGLAGAWRKPRAVLLHYLAERGV